MCSKCWGLRIFKWTRDCVSQYYEKMCGYEICEKVDAWVTYGLWQDSWILFSLGNCKLYVCLFLIFVYHYIIFYHCSRGNCTKSKNWEVKLFLMIFEDTYFLLTCDDDNIMEQVVSGISDKKTLHHMHNSHLYKIRWFAHT